MARRLAGALAVSMAGLAGVACPGGPRAVAAPAMERVIVAMRPAAYRLGPASARGHGGRIAERLRARSDAGQRSIRDVLRAARAAGRVRTWKPLWIADAIAVTATADMIAELRRRPDVAAVRPDAVAIAPSAVEPGIALASAPGAWSRGATGAGVVVAALDSGVDATHPALSGAYRGGTGSWFDPYGEHTTGPYDATGHGTSTMGVMVGAGGIGMAPDARWIAARVFDDAGGATEGAIHQAFQWALDPDGDPATDDAPDVVVNSWNGTYAGCDTRFQPDLRALVAAGIVPVFAAGNEGPAGAGANASPANLPEALAVGAVDELGAVAAFSSRGPSACGGAPFPAIVAPGVNVRSTGTGGSFVVSSGTSLSAPHAAGALALALSASPGVPASTQRTLVQTTAAPIAGAEAAAAGAGLVDASALVAAVLAAASVPPDTVPPATSAPQVASVVTGRQDVPARATLTDDRSALAAAEAFVDVAGDPGTGIPLPAADGTFDSSVEVAAGSVPQAVVAGLAPGRHVILIRGRDAAGNWGPASGSGFVVDRDGPSLTGGPTGPARVTRGEIAVFTVRATDPANGLEPGGTVARIETSAATTVTPVDGALDGAGERLRVEVRTAVLADGPADVTLRAYDAHGNAGEPFVLTIQVRAPGPLLRDDFESGIARGWTARSGRVHVSGRRGHRMLVAPGGPPALAYVASDSPDAEAGYTASFTLDARQALTGPRDIFAGLDRAGARVFAVQMARRAGGAARVRVVDAAGGRSPWLSIRAGGTAVTLSWCAGARDGLSLTAGGRHAPPIPATGGLVEAVRLGVVTQRAAPALRGAVRFDAFASSRRVCGGRRAL